MTRPRILLLIAVATCVLLAGCGGQTGGGTNATDTTVANATPTPGGNATPTRTATPTPDPASPREVKAAAVRAMAGVNSYRIDANILQRYAGGVNQTLNISTTASIDREARALNTTQTQVSGGQTTTVQTYFVDGAIYSKSPAYQRRFDSKWVVRKPKNATQSWRNLDTIRRQKAILNASEVSLAGTESVNGTDAYLLLAEVPPQRYKQLATNLPGSNVNGSRLTVKNASFKFWVDTDSYRPVRSVGVVNIVVKMNRRTFRINQRLVIDYGGYDRSIDVTLPKAAEDAKRVGNSSRRR